MSPSSLAVLAALPETAMVPVAWVRELVAGLGIVDGEADPLGLTVAEVAARTGRAESTVRTWAAEGRLPGAKRLRGREWRIPHAALAALLENDDPPGRGSAVQRLAVPKGGLSAWRNGR